MAARRRQRKPQLVFHLFGQLPPELRIDIWVRSLEPRTVSIYPMNENYFLLPGGKNQLPATAYVNAESRHETLPLYQRAFAHPDGSDFRWFNFRLDTLCVASDLFFGFLRHLDRGDLKQLERLILYTRSAGIISARLPCSDTWPMPVTQSVESSRVAKILKDYFPKLKEITLVKNGWSAPVYSMSVADRLRRNQGRYSKVKEVTLTREHWPGPVPGVSGDEWKDYYLFKRNCLFLQGPMQTTYVNGLKVRHSTMRHETDERSSYRQMDQASLRFLAGIVEKLLQI